ncbi:hypothetical protein ACP70R_010908 [Stipagrostis hirtigluma subsp. patula]
MDRPNIRPALRAFSTTAHVWRDPQHLSVPQFSPGDPGPWRNLLVRPPPAFALLSNRRRRRRASSGDPSEENSSLDSSVAIAPPIIPTSG